MSQDVDSMRQMNKSPLDQHGGRPVQRAKIYDFIAKFNQTLKHEAQVERNKYSEPFKEIDHEEPVIIRSSCGSGIGLIVRVYVCI